MDELVKVAAAGSEDELVRELVDELSPLFMQPYNMAFSADSHLLSPPHFSPTLDDSYGIHGLGNHMSEADVRISMMERSHLKKANHDNINKYTLRINNCGTVMADDGYKWRKYGQKSIKNSPNPRSYYRCTNSRCNAKKQVERSIEDPEILIITYEGLHLHYTYPFLFLNDQQQPTKKHRGPIITKAEAHYFPAQAQNMMAQQGLLEDVVPLTIRKPANSSQSSSSISHDRSSQPSSPASSNSLSAYSYLGII
ncbi:WRKY transcription factor, variant 2 [Salvia divinorum]